MAKTENGNGWRQALIVMIVPLVACGVGWGTLTSTTSHLEDDFDDLKADCSRMGKIETDIAVIRSRMESYDKNMKEMNETLKGVPDAWHLRAAERKAAAAVVDGGE